MPGIIAVLIGQDLAQHSTPLRMAPPIEGLQPVTIPSFPLDKVRFNGDLVACVVAITASQAEDAAEQVRVDYETLPAIVSAADALRDDAARVDDALPGNLISHQQFSTGDPARRFAAAHRVVEATFSQHRQTHAPLETRGCCAIWDGGREHLTMHVGNQAPHPYRTQLAQRLGLSESQVMVICPDIGGAFGQKITLYREELTVAVLARLLNRPVRWRESRGENLLAASHAREQTAQTRAAVDAEGHITALEVSILEDFGAYCFYPANYMARVVAMVLTGPYRIADYAFDVRVVLTNKCGAGPMRAPMAITSWVMDGTIEAVARALGLDPIEVRRRNMLQAGDLPYIMPTNETLYDIAPARTFEAALDAFDVKAFRARQAADRTHGVYRGMGICAVVEPTTYGSAFYKAAGIPGSGHEAAWVKVAPSGAVDAAVGLMSSGQGYETTLAQAVAEGLGVIAEDVRLHTGNTDTAPYGMGSRGARGGTAGGSVLWLAGQAVQRKVCAIAAARLGLNSGDELRLRDGSVQRPIAGGWENTGLRLADIARIAYLDPLSLPDGMEPGLEAHRAYDPPTMTYSNATHVCEAVVDIETGAVRLERYLVAEDCGQALNPMITEGQQHGAVALGIGGVAARAGGLRRLRPEPDRQLHGLRHDHRRRSAIVRCPRRAHADQPQPHRSQGHVGRRCDGRDRRCGQRGQRCARAVRDRGRAPAADAARPLRVAVPALSPLSHLRQDDPAARDGLNRHRGVYVLHRLGQDDARPGPAPSWRPACSRSGLPRRTTRRFEGGTQRQASRRSTRNKPAASRRPSWPME